MIDLTIGQIARDGDRYMRIFEAGQAEYAEYAYSRCDNEVVPNARKLIDAFHANGAPVIYTTCASQTGDGSDQTWRHRAFGHICAADSRDAQVVDALAPEEGDILLVKTGSSVFNSTASNTSSGTCVGQRSWSAGSGRTAVSKALLATPATETSVSCSPRMRARP